MSEVSNIPDQPMGVNPYSDDQAQQDQVAQPTQQQQTSAQPSVQSQTPNAQSGIQNARTGVQNIKDAKAAQPQTPHASMFSKILETMSGGPTRYIHTDPATGATTQVIEHRPKNAMASSILAAALSGMFAGEAAPGGRNPATGGLDLSGAAQAGSAVGQAAAQKPSQQAQSLDDAKRATLINTTDHNLKVHQLMLNNTKLQGDILQSTVDDAEPIITALDTAQPVGGEPIIQKQNVTEDELNKMLQDKSAHVTRDSVLPDGTADVYDENGKQVMNPDGTPKKTFTYTVYDHNAMVTMTDELRKANPELVSAASGQQLPVKVLAKLWRQRGESSVAQGYVNDFQKRMDAMTGKTSTPIEFNAAVKANPTLAGLKPILGRYAGMDPDQALDQMRKDKVDPNVVGAFQKLFNVTDTDWANYREASKKKADIANDPDKQPVPPAQVASFPGDVKKSYPGLTPGQVSSLQKQLGPNPRQKDYKEAQDRAEKYDAANTARQSKQDENADKNQQTMWKTGINPKTQERLSLTNAPDESLVDTRTGNPIPTGMLSTLKPTMQESNRADFAKSAIHSLDKLNDLIDSNEAKFGPIVGPVDKWMASHGLGDEYQQAALNYLTFAQSAATGAHVGGRFNVPIMDKMGTTISANMSKDQLKGATESISDVMQQYVDQGGRFTVAQYKALPQTEKDRLQGKTKAQPTQQGQQSTFDPTRFPKAQ